MGLAWVLGWTMIAGFFFGLSLSFASTVVLLRALQTHNLIDTERGRIATGWLIVEDLAMVLALVLLPTIAPLTPADGGGSVSTLLWASLVTSAKIAGFIVFVLIFGRRMFPALMHWVARSAERRG